MNFEQMEYIKEVVDTKSMSLAAQNLHVSQSAISQSISLLEKEIGIKLFKRSRFGTVPTDEGKNIIKKVLEILKKVDEMKGEVQAITSSYKGELKIATISSLFLTILPKSLSRFKKDFPQIKMTILEMESKEIIEAVDKLKVDLGFLGINADLQPKLTEEIAFQSLHYQGGIKVIVPMDSPLAFYNELTVKDIIDYPFVMYASRYWENLTGYIQEHIGPINIMFETTNTEVIKKTVSEGLGISLLSSLMLLDDPYVESQRIVAIPLADYSLFQNFSFGWIHSKNHPHLRLVKKFLEYVEG
ncbi:LysR family transcriptional regulator [Bacillus sp. DNRA2]|uniref:LysR family transcriptional regulator n=1 Tax=Bacillus sp. DNRA2 TaxID=2723053 RepID=UPI00145C71B7|nr:LysR family transcriptional regulator [Bacillus sp. DNRA2]NMD71303.1 LysR family transcriptional regulator [Bacillus sp. DNRA2]